MDFRRGEKSRLSKIYNLNKSFYFNQIESANREFKYSDYLSSSSFKYSQNTKVKYKTKRINPEKAILGETKLFDLSTKVKIDDNIEDLNFEIKHLNKIERKELDPQTKGYLYEEEIAHVFENLGFSTEVTSKSNDYGADIIAIKNNKKYAIQVKYRNKENITVGAIQEVLGAIGYYKADQGIVVANKEFTYSAKILAKENDVILVNGDDITSIRKKLAI